MSQSCQECQCLIEEPESDQIAVDVNAQQNDGTTPQRTTSFARDRKLTHNIDALKQWTGKTSATIVYDNTVDESTHNGLFEKVKGKRNIALIATTADGDVFGAFYSVAVTEQQKDFDDPDIFIFSFESHGRCETPQRFVVHEESKDRANVWLEMSNDSGFVCFTVSGYGWFWLGDERSDSFCFELSTGFEGLEDTTLTGEKGSWTSGPYHHCTRLLAVHLS